MEGINIKLTPSSPKRYILLKYKKATLLLADVILVNDTILLGINNNFYHFPYLYLRLDFSSIPLFSGGGLKIPPFFTQSSVFMGNLRFLQVTICGFNLVIRLLDKKELYINFKYERHNSISESFYIIVYIIYPYSYFILHLKCANFNSKSYLQKNIRA